MLLYLVFMVVVYFLTSLIVLVRFHKILNSVQPMELIEELGALVDFVVDVSSSFSNLKLGVIQELPRKHNCGRGNALEIYEYL